MRLSALAAAALAAAGTLLTPSPDLRAQGAPAGRAAAAADSLTIEAIFQRGASIP